MEDVLAGLNPSQLQAVTTTEGPVRVIAGAGSGKTRALSRRFAYLVNEMGIMAANILCVTFTNKAANEMRARIHALTGDNDTAYVNTFHGFCVSVLQEDSKAINFPKSFLVLDNSDIDAMLAIIYEERGLTLRDMTFKAARDLFEMRKCADEPLYWKDLVDMDLASLRGKYEAAQSVEDILFYGYLYQQKKCFGLDYNDLIILTLAIFGRDEAIRLKWQQRLEYIMIDEFQDIDPLQHKLMEVLAAYHKNLFIVGDPDQTIYSWRGASVRFLLDFDKLYPGCTTIMMNENYRSTPQVVAVANSLISKNALRVEKSLASLRESGESVLCHHAKSAEDEAAWIADQMRYLHEEQGIPFKRMAVLYRAHYLTRAVEEALIKAELPYRIYSGTTFFDRREVKDALSYLRMVAYGDDLSFARIANAPKRNIGNQRMKFLQQYAQARDITLFEALRATLEDPLFKGTGARDFVGLIDKYALSSSQLAVSELLGALLDESGYERALRTEGSQERLDNLAELKQSIYEYETTCGEEATLMRYLTHAAFFSNLDQSMEADKVKLMTVHAAKGLEFSQVFLCGMNEGVFPSRKVRSIEGMEEERRLAFVAMTRARDRLFISDAEGSSLDGSPRYPSRFILDIDQKLLVYDVPPADSLVEQAKAWIASKNARMLAGEQALGLRAGDRVRHRQLGEGTILHADAEAKSYSIKFDEVATPRTLSAQAPLEKL